MPITIKDDVRTFGKDVVNMLTTWGNQIQEAKDIATYKKISDNLSDVKKLTTNSNGEVKSVMELGRDMFQTATRINTSIRNPELKNQLGVTLGQMYNSIFKGLGTQEEKKQDIGEGQMLGTIPKVDENGNPITATQSPVYGFGEASMTKVGTGFSKQEPYKYQLSKGQFVNAVDTNGNIIPNKYSWKIPVLNRKTGTMEYHNMGDKDRTELTAEEKVMADELDRQNKLKVAKMNQYSYNDRPFGTGQNSFIDKDGKVLNLNVDLKSGRKFVYGDKGAKIFMSDKELNDKGYKPISENINPDSKNSTMTYEQKIDNAWKIMKTQFDKDVMIPNPNSRYGYDIVQPEDIFRDVMNFGEESKYWNMLSQNQQDNLRTQGLIPSKK